MRRSVAFAAGVAFLSTSVAIAQPNSDPCQTSSLAGTIVAIDVPGADVTYVSGINNPGQIVGTYSASGSTRGFVLDKGVYTDLTVAGSTTTRPEDINSSGVIVGGFDDSTGSHGFVWDDGAVTTLDVPGALATAARGINDAGTVVGTFLSPGGEDGVEHGFIYRDGVFTVVDYPGASGTGLLDINSAGTVLGSFVNPQPAYFLYDAGTFTVIAECVPNMTLVDITSSGRLIGSIPTGVNSTAGVVVTRNGLLLVDVPDATFTVLVAGNSGGSLIGRYQDASLVEHAFLFIPR
jgi:probable HAF family extracellular repeat protein